MAKIAIVSDVHLGTRQCGLDERYDDFHIAFRRFGKSVVERKVDAVVIGGDLFDSTFPDAKSVYVAKQVVDEIKKAGIRVLGIDGNHDLSDGYWMCIVGVEVLDEHKTVDIEGVSVTGIPYRNGRDFVFTIRQMANEGIKADILVAHFALAEMNGGGTADAEVKELSPSLDRLGAKAVLMGHVHMAYARKFDGVLYVNPGSVEHKTSNEPKEKCYMIVDTDSWEAEKIPLPTRRVVTMKLANEQHLLDLVVAMVGEVVLAQDKEDLGEYRRDAREKRDRRKTCVSDCPFHGSSVCTQRAVLRRSADAGDREKGEKRRQPEHRLLSYG